MGDFSGRENRGLKQIHGALAKRQTINVDRDNFDDVINRLGVQLTSTIVDSDNQPVSVRFSELDDFEPDQLFASVELFDRLRLLREQLMNGSTFAAAAAEVRSWSKSDNHSPSTIDSDSEVQQQVSLDDILSSSQTQQGAPAQGTSRWDEMIRHLVAPLIVAGPDPNRDVLVQCVDAAISESMRKLLHHTDFQRLESAWRGLSMLIRRLDTDGDLQIHLLDISPKEIAQDLQLDDVADSGLYRLIVEESVGTAGGQPWSAIIGCDTFSAAAGDVVTLQNLAKIAAAAEAPFIGGIAGDAVGCSNPGATPDSDGWQAPATTDLPQWRQLLGDAEASALQLLWPRFRIRLPYGSATRQIDAFEFEELLSTPPGDHEDYLWCSPAFAAALVLGQSFMANGWNMKPGEIDDVDDLPLCYHVNDDEETVALPCGELWLTDRVAARIRQAGITPLMSVKSRAAVRVGSFRGVNGEPLMGRWN